MLHTATSSGAPVRALLCLLVITLSFACNSGTLAEGGNDPSPQYEAQNVSADSGTSDDCDSGVWCPPPSDHGCGPGVFCPTPDAGVEVTVENFGARGEFTSPSFLTTAPPGAALLAQNVVVDVTGEYTTARGFERLPAGIPGDYEISAWTVYQGAIIAHVAETSTLYRYVSGAWTAFPGTYFAPTPGLDADGDPIPGQMKFFEAQQALYFTTAAGVYRIEGVTEVPARAGAVAALPGTASITSAGQALSPSASTAFRYAWGRRATNGRIMLGAPSDRITVTNRTEDFTFSPSAMTRAVSGVVTLTVAPGVANAIVVGQSIELTAVDPADLAVFPLGVKTVTGVGPSTVQYVAASGTPGSATAPGGASFASSATAVKIAHTVQVPEGLDDSYFFQAYRADEVPLNTEPSDEMYLVHEKAVSAMASKHVATSLVRIGGIVYASMTEPHGLLVGAQVSLTNEFTDPGDAINFPPGTKIVSAVLSATSFQYIEAGPDIGTVGQAMFLWLFSYSFEDDTPDAFKGDPLYTNVNSGGGAGTAHYSPPDAAVSVVFANRAFYANTHLPERLELTVLAVGPGGLDVDNGLVFTSGVTTLTYAGAATEDIATRTFQVFTSGTPAQNIANTVTSLVRVINSTPGGLIYAHDVATAGDPLSSGKLLIESRTSSALPVSVRTISAAPYILPALGYRAAVASMDRAGGVTTVTTFTGYPHGFVVGQVVRRTQGLVGDPNFPDGDVTVMAVPDALTFSFNELLPDATLATAGFMFSTTGEDVRTDDEAAPGGFMVSDLSNPDSVPATLPEIVGDRYKRILRMVQVGNALFFLKEDGLYRLLGTDPTNYTVDCVDPTIRFVAPRAAWVLNNRAYALTSQGLASWTESSNPEPAALQIEDQLRAAVEHFPTLVDQTAFAVAHESKRRAYLWLPDEDGFANARLHVFNATNDAWTRWTKPAVDAFIHPTEDRLWLANPDVDGDGTSPAPSVERNSGTNADYQDEDGNAIEALVTWTPTVPPESTLQQQIARVTYSFKNTTPTALDVSYMTDWVPEPLWWTLDASSSTSPGTLTTVPDQDHSRGNTHTLSVRHAVVNEPMRLLGFSAQARYWVRLIP